MRVAWGTLYRLLCVDFGMPLVVSFFYWVAALLVYLDVQARGGLIATTSSLAAAGFTLLISDRVIRYGSEGGAIGLPDHVRALRAAQILGSCLFVGLPILVSWHEGATLLAASAIVCAGYGGAVYLVVYRRAALTTAIGIYLIAKTVGHRVVRGAWLAQPVVQGLVVAASLFLAFRWLELPERSGRLGGVASFRLADASHELPQAEIQTAERREVVYVLSPADLGFGLRYSTGTQWQAMRWLLFVGVAVVAIWHYVARWFDYRPSTGYFGVMALIAATLLGRATALLEGWRNWTTEQALLKLTPVWPAQPILKGIIIRSTLEPWRGGFCVWAALSVVALLFGWIGRAAVADAALALIALFCATSASFWLLISQQLVRRIHVWSVVIGVLTAVSCAPLIFVDDLSAAHIVLCFTLILASPLAALARLYWVTLQIPLRTAFEER